MANPTLANGIENNSEGQAESYSGRWQWTHIPIDQKQTWKVTYIINCWRLKASDTITDQNHHASWRSVCYVVYMSMRTRISTSSIPNPFLHYSGYLYSHGTLATQVSKYWRAGRRRWSHSSSFYFPLKVLEWEEVISSEKKLKRSLEGAVYAPFSAHRLTVLLLSQGQKDSSKGTRKQSILFPKCLTKYHITALNRLLLFIRKHGTLPYSVLLAHDLFFILSRVSQNLH